MPAVRLTNRKLQSLRTTKTQEDFFCDRIEGFGVRVSGNTGKKTFFVRYRTRGRRRRITIGRYPALSLADARDLARATLGEVARGEDPAADAKRGVVSTFGELCDVYLERWARPNKAPKSIAEDERQIEKDLRPAWGTLPPEAITKDDVIRLLDSIVDRGAGVMANRTLALISRIYTFGMDRELVGANPAYKVKPPTVEHERQRVMTDAEIKRFWSALNSLTPLMASGFRLRLLTAQRGIEVLSMRLDALDGGWWTVPAEVSKTKEAHRVPLSPQALEVIESIGPLSRNGCVFPSRTGGHIASVSKAAARMREKAKIENWRPHDLRRTASTKMTGELGVSRFIVGRILNHKEGGVTRIYDRAAYEAEKREALEKWGAFVKDIVS